MRYTEDDVDVAVEALLDMQQYPDEYAGPIVCVFSFGYGSVHIDGAVVAHKQIVFTVANEWEVS